MKKKILVSIFIILIALNLIQCAPGSDHFSLQAKANFLHGLWHGAISAITLVLQIFSDNVKTYEVDNIGAWYDFGFWLGAISIWGSGSHQGIRRARRRKIKIKKS